MAGLVATPTVDHVEAGQKLIHVYGSIDFDNGDYAAGGPVVDLSDFSDELYGVPIDGNVYSGPVVANKATALYFYSWLFGAGLDDSQVQIWVGNDADPMAELGNGAVPAGVSGDTVRFHLVFKKN
jgi:hypothetical protein